MMIILFLDDAPFSLTIWSALLALLTFIILVGSAVIVLVARRKDTTATFQLERAEASEALVKTRDQQLKDCTAVYDKCHEDKDALEAELKAQMALNITDLMDYWEVRTSEQAKMKALEKKVKVLELSNQEGITK